MCTMFFCGFIRMNDPISCINGVLKKATYTWRCLAIDLYMASVQTNFEAIRFGSKRSGQKDRETI